MLKLKGIKKDYKVADGYVHALKGIDLDFRKNEFVCILGQSGCGKTTLLNIIGGLDHYTEGDLIVQGMSTKNFKDRDWDVYRNHRIGFIFQSYNLIPHQTVLGNVELALTIAGVGREERRKRAIEALEQVGLGEEINKHPNQLSGGQMQRVAIARALVNNPDILLADEPTGALDSKTSVQIMDLIREISGERLVIMVTHNPELAEEYATRIVKLKDGLVESDSAPYDSQGEEEAWNASREEQTAKEQDKKGKGKKARARMSFLTSLALSARNLLTKKGRTILTSVAGSIGIISVSLVLALSSGFNNYIRRTEEDMLSYYPLSISENPFDMTAVMGNIMSANQMPDMSNLQDKAYVNSFLTGLAQKMAVTNDISEKYLNYIEKMDPALVNTVQYSYGAGLSDNLFTSVTVGGINDEVKEETVRNFSISQLKAFYISELRTYAPSYNNLLGMADFFGNIVHKMPGTADTQAENFGDFVLSQYDVIGENAHFPQNANEIVLVVGEDNRITDMTAAQLGILSEKTFISPFLEENGTAEEEWDHLIDLSDIIGKKYILYFNDAVYNETGELPITGGYPFEYNGEKETLSANGEEGIELTVTAILRLKEGYTYGCLTEGLNITEEATLKYIEKNMQSKIVKWLKSDSAKVPKDLIDRYGALMEIPAGIDLYYSPASHLNDENGFFSAGTLSFTYNVDSVVRLLGGDNTPNALSIYPRDFDTKEDVLAYLDAWNELETTEESEKITYTDTVGLLMGMVQTMLDVITYVLVAFTAISLVVSSVMIGIITYVSVVERVKEIGVLRSLGARKRDIKNLFNAETFIIGLAAGLIGAAVTYLLEIPINAIIYSLSGISGIASLPILTAGIMVIISVVLTLISGLIPASAAAKKDPVIALRTE